MHGAIGDGRRNSSVVAGRLLHGALTGAPTTLCSLTVNRWRGGISTACLVDVADPHAGVRSCHRHFIQARPRPILRSPRPKGIRRRSPDHPRLRQDPVRKPQTRQKRPPGRSGPRLGLRRTPPLTRRDGALPQLPRSRSAPRSSPTQTLPQAPRQPPPLPQDPNALQRDHRVPDRPRERRSVRSVSGIAVIREPKSRLSRAVGITDLVAHKVPPHQVVSADVEVLRQH